MTEKVPRPCDCGADGDGIGGCPRCLGAGELYAEVALIDQVLNMALGSTITYANRSEAHRIMLDYIAAREAAAEARVLDDLERRIRHQAKAAAVGSMEWRAHFADLAHLEAVRMEYAAAQAAPSRVPGEES